MANRIFLLLAVIALAVVLVVALNTRSDSEVDTTPSPDPERPAREELPPDFEDLFLEETDDPEPESGPEPMGAAALVVTVLDSAKAPFPGARVYVAVPWTRTKPVSATTGADGTCRLEELPTNRKVNVTATAGPTWIPASRGLQLDEAKETKVSLTLTEGGAVEGRLLDEAGMPIPGKHKVTVSPGQANLAGGVQVRRGRRGRNYSGQAVDGEFLVRGVRPGKYEAIGNATGYENGKSETFEVKKGQVTSGIVITMSRGGAVSGVVVRMKTGEPVAGAAVSLGPKGAAGGLRDFVIVHGSGVGLASRTQEKTDDQGRFLVSGVKAGTYSLVVTAKDLAPSTVEEVVVEKDRETGGILVSLGEGGAITGTVYGPGGEPVPGAEVLYSRLISQIRIMGNFGRKVKANEMGVYFIDHLAPGDYHVRRAQGGAGGAMSVSVMVTGLPGSDPARERDPDAVAVHEGQVTRFDIRADARCAIRGTLTDAAGRPVRKTVQLRSEQQARNVPGIRTRINIPRMTFPDAKGLFVFDSLEPGEYVVSVEGLEERVSVSGGETRSVEFRLDSASVAGVVRNDRGEPAKRARVSLHRLRATPGGSGFSSSYSSAAVADDQGRFTFEGVQPGTYRVSAAQGSPGGDSAEFSVASGQEVTGIEVVLDSPVKIRIEVLGTEGSPRADVTVMLFRSGGRPYSGTTGEGVAAEFEVAPGRYRVIVRPVGGQVTYMPTEIEVGRGGSQTFTVRPR